MNDDVISLDAFKKKKAEKDDIVEDSFVPPEFKDKELNVVAVSVVSEYEVHGDLPSDLEWKAIVLMLSKCNLAISSDELREIIEHDLTCEKEPDEDTPSDEELRETLGAIGEKKYFVEKVMINGETTEVIAILDQEEDRKE